MLEASQTLINIDELGTVDNKLSTAVAKHPDRFLSCLHRCTIVMDVMGTAQNSNVWYHHHHHHDIDKQKDP